MLLRLLETATRGLLATDHVILNHGQVTWTTPELASPSPNYHTNGRTFQLSTDLTCIAALHGESLVVLGRTRDKASHGPIPIPLGYRGQTVLEVKREEFVDDALIFAKGLGEELRISFEPPRRIRRKHIW
ncbi:hypothetical protein TNCV_2726631 [Trichonephila clavipes]|nr:hypothetical protein TNCV_2726631 [Trichonephila clavipes]